jgi:drug/metabolite transporter (DMT)-like permease
MVWTGIRLDGSTDYRRIHCIRHWQGIESKPFAQQLGLMLSPTKPNNNIKSLYQFMRQADLPLAKTNPTRHQPINQPTNINQTETNHAEQATHHARQNNGGAARMTGKLTLKSALLLIVPPLLWAGNAVVGRAVHTYIPPITLNFVRWLLALLILLPLAWPVYRRGSGLWTHWRHFALLGLLGVGMYNALQYLALQSSTPINVTLMAASMPIWMLLVGRYFFGGSINTRQWLGALLSIAGVLLVLARGQWQLLLQLKLVAGDLYMLLATLCWAFYSWLLTRGGAASALKGNWAHFLLAQVSFGLLWSGLCTGGEWLLTAPTITWNGTLVAALLFVAVGPAVIAYRCWGAGVAQVGPNLAAFFANLTPLFAAVLSAAFLGEFPHLYHGAAFLLIAGGIVLSARH